MYKNIQFNLIDFYENKTILLDDTCYFISFENKEKAEFIYKLLTSDISKIFINSIIFQDNKRIITASILNRINFKNLALYLNLEEEYKNNFN
jgi:hypothetical protein